MSRSIFHHCRQPFSRVKSWRSIVSVLGVVVGVTALGLYLLCSSHAATSSVSVEPEKGSLSGGAAVVPDSSASGGQAVRFGGQTAPPAAAQLKPQFRGTVDRHHIAAAAYWPVINNYIVQIPWSNVQPNDNKTLASNNLIDQAIAEARAHHMHIKLRLLAGNDSPAWADNLPVTTGQPGPFNICDDHAVGAPPNCGPIPHFWENDFKAAYQHYLQLLAAKYDSTPEIEEVTIAMCTTIFDEPLLRQADLPANIAAYNAAGYSEAANLSCLHDSIDFHKVWTTTRSSFAFNPYNQFTGTGFKPNEAITESLIDYCRASLGPRCVLGNNSIGPSRLGYQQMYDKIKSMGKPIYFQTETPAKLGSAAALSSAISWAATQGAGMVELPTGYDTWLSPSQLQPLDSALEANALN